MGIKAVLFDADNTLFPTRSVAKRADLAAMGSFAKNSSMNKNDIYREWRKIVSKIRHLRNPELRTRNYSYWMLAKKLGIRGHAKAYSGFVRELLRLLRPFSGTAKILGVLRRRGFKLAVITEDSKDLAMKKLRKTRLAGYFSTVVASDDIGSMKPSIQYIRVAAKRMNVEPRDCIVVSDSYELDLKAAKKAGAKVLLANKGILTLLPGIP